MSITPEQREARRKYIGSSDSASIMGACPWSDAYDVYVSKVLGEGKKQTDSMREATFSNPPASRGHSGNSMRHSNSP